MTRALLLLSRTYGDSAEDCVQECFIRLAIQEPGHDNPKARPFRAERHASNSQVRSAQRRREWEFAVFRERLRWFETRPVEDNELPDADQLQNALSKLEHQTRDLIVAHIWANMTFRDIASAFDLKTVVALDGDDLNSSSIMLRASSVVGVMDRGMISTMRSRMRPFVLCCPRMAVKSLSGSRRPAS